MIQVYQGKVVAIYLYQEIGGWRIRLYHGYSQWNMG